MTRLLKYFLVGFLFVQTMQISFADLTTNTFAPKTMFTTKEVVKDTTRWPAYTTKEVVKETTGWSVHTTKEIVKDSTVYTTKETRKDSTVSHAPDGTASYTTTKGLDACEGFECNFQGELCHVNDSGHPSCICGEVCGAVYAPVCASNGKTYSNRCFMNMAACQSRVPLNVTYMGECYNTTDGTTSDFSEAMGYTTAGNASSITPVEDIRTTKKSDVKDSTVFPLAAAIVLGLVLAAVCVTYFVCLFKEKEKGRREKLNAQNQQQTTKHELQPAEAGYSNTVDETNA